MFASRFWLPQDTLLSEADLSVFFEPDGALISEDNFSKILPVFKTLFCEGDVGDTISLANHLAVTWSTFRPSLHLALLMVDMDKWIPFSLESSFWRPEI